MQVYVYAERFGESPVYLAVVLTVADQIILGVM